jgi:CRISPR-associated endonuclease/helicase Cas3
MSEPPSAIVDVAFAVEGTSLAADHAWQLWAAVEGRLPWLAEEASAGIHPLRAAPTTYGVVLLAQRAKLVLRLPETRVPESLMLQDTLLAVGTNLIKIGVGSARTLRASATLSALRVAAGTDDLGEFEALVATWLKALGIDCGVIAGRRRVSHAGDREIVGFGLALHGLAMADSLRIQREGLGTDRRMGWGVFVPAKAIAAAEA